MAAIEHLKYALDEALLAEGIIKIFDDHLTKCHAHVRAAAEVLGLADMSPRMRIVYAGNHSRDAWHAVCGLQDVLMKTMENLRS